MFNFNELKQLFPILGEKIELRLFQEQDISASYISWLNDPEVMKYSNQRFKNHSRDSCRQYLASFKESEAFFIAICMQDSHELIGTLTVYFNSNHRVADIGIMIGDKTRWGQGIGKDAWNTMLQTLLQLGLRKVTGGTLACNKGMLKIMRDTGMQEDGKRNNQELVDGQAYDLLYFASYNPIIDTAIVAHDSGAANHLISWLKTGYLDQEKVRLCFAGPALVMLQKTFPDQKNYSLSEVFEGVRLLITGTGWQTSLEYDARAHARKLNIKSIAVVDHWINYQERFTYNNIQILPDEIWVVDHYAKKMAEEYFPDVQVNLKPNDYCTLQLKEIKTCELETSKTKILFLMEPMRVKWNNLNILGEIQAFNYFINHMNHLEIAEQWELIIKPHPTDPVGKYKFLEIQDEHSTITVDETATLTELIGWSNIVVGCHTYGMVLALYAGRTVISSIPESGPVCMLPHPEIIVLADLVNCREVL